MLEEVLLAEKLKEHPITELLERGIPLEIHIKFLPPGKIDQNDYTTLSALMGAWKTFGAEFGYRSGVVDQLKEAENAIESYNNAEIVAAAGNLITKAKSLEAKLGTPAAMEAVDKPAFVARFFNSVGVTMLSVIDPLFEVDCPEKGEGATRLVLRSQLLSAEGQS